MLRNSGISPMPSGSSRQTSSVMPGRMVGLTMPTTPRQLENAICEFLAFLPFNLFRVGAGYARPGDVPFRYIARNRRCVALARVAVAAGAGALQQKALPRFHVDPRRRRRLEFLRRAHTHHETGTAAFFTAIDPFRWKARLVETADDSGVLQQLVFALHGEAAAPLPGAGRI